MHLVFVDEVDKIRSQVAGRVNVAGIRAQEALLTLIENESVPFTLPEWAGRTTVTVDSSDAVRLEGLAEEAARSRLRLYGGIHDRHDNQDGLLRDRKVAERALARFHEVEVKESGRQ